MTDAQLALLSQQGDREAFGVLARRWDGPLYRHLRRLLGDGEAARDTCQEALLRAWANLHRLREPAHFRSWLHAIALNLCRDRGRSRPLREVGLDDEVVSGLISEQASPLAEAVRGDLAAVLQRALDRLPMEQRSAILLRELEGFTSQEIATIAGVPATTVRSRIYYGLKALRRMLPEYGVTSERSGEGGMLQ